MLHSMSAADSPPWRAGRIMALILACTLFTAGAIAEDQGARRHAEGSYDPSTATYTVVKGDDLEAIAARFSMSLADLKAQNALDTNRIDVGQTLDVAGGAQPSGSVARNEPGAAVYTVVSGTEGSPAAKATIDGAQLPPPPPPFGGVIKDGALQSTPWWPPTVVPPEDAPNILLILTDDAGFAIPSTFGGVIPTPSMDRIANAGLRYNRMMSTSLCSPTRAALITGRNHHSVGFGVIAEQATGFPGYDSVIGVDNATIGRILRDNGYATSWFGKDHNTPTYQASQAGPFTQWPTGLGFDYFYGFVGGDANQWQPNLFRNTTQIYPFNEHPSTLKMDRSDPNAEIGRSRVRSLPGT